jgi:heme-degrading monooxygenase HmoA
MPNFQELDNNVSLNAQMYSKEDGSIILINVFTVNPEEKDALLSAWKHDADFMRAQPGYISTQLHEGIADSSTFINYAVWENVESFRAAFTQPEFQKRISEYPESAVASPHLFKKLTVSGHCVS